MKLKSFRVQNYRSIDDSGWIEVEDIACIVGKNEAGKTSLLKALWKFKPFKAEPYSLDREWPRGRRKERDSAQVVCSCKFSFTKDEEKQLASLHECCEGINEATISKQYGGKMLYTFGPKNPPNEHPLAWTLSVLDEHLDLESSNGKCSTHFREQYAAKLQALYKAIKENGGCEYAIENLPAFRKTVSRCISPDGNEHPMDNEVIQHVHAKIDSVVTELKTETPVRKAIDLAHSWLPTFIYMDDYRVFAGRAQLDQVRSRRDQDRQEAADETVIMIMEQSGLDLDEEVKKGQDEDREQRMLDMNDASQTLTNEIATRWSQKKYEVQFQVDGQHFITFVKDTGKPVLVPLEERSKGFQWFFSFDMMFMCETQGEFKNAVILLDEPGLHLHASAQRDLLKRMYAYAESNQLVYSTHLPFMVDPKKLTNIHICEETPEGTRVHQNWQTANADSRFTLQAALGLSWSQSLFVGQYNLVVEGITDFWYLTAISSLLSEAGEQALDPELIVTPAGGASKVAYVATILRGQELHTCVVLDSDSAGESAYHQLVHNWLLEEKLVLRLGAILGVKGEIAIEDIFDEAYFLGFVSSAYASELGGKAISFTKSDKRSVVDKTEDALSKLGIASFNKGRVAKLILRDIGTKKLADYSPDTQESFRKIVAAVNTVAERFRVEHNQAKR